MNKQSLHRSMQRREFLRSVSLAGMAALLPRFSVAHADTDARFVLIILRGALDGMAAVASAAGKMLKQADGPRIAVMEATGWDTHANQGAERGQLATRLSGLDEALETLRLELDAAWQQTAVLITTEFGRTAAINGTRGTDHGTGTCAFLLGGAINGGRVIADWPGLADHNLYQGRDLKPTLDIRSVCKGVLATHLGVVDALLETRIFADSRTAKPLDGLIRSA